MFDKLFGKQCQNMKIEKKYSLNKSKVEDDIILHIEINYCLVKFFISNHYYSPKHGRQIVC